MVSGDKDIFAIACEVTTTIGDWVYGQLLFWVRGVRIGNPDDAADLKGCRNWLRDFINEPRDRFEPALTGLDAGRVFVLVHAPTMTGGNGRSVFADAFARFNIGHLGMSSFDRYDVLLIEEPTVSQRILWREGNGPAQDAYLPPDRIQSVTRECLAWMDTAF